MGDRYLIIRGTEPFVVRCSSIQSMILRDYCIVNFYTNLRERYYEWKMPIPNRSSEENYHRDCSKNQMAFERIYRFVFEGDGNSPYMEIDFKKFGEDMTKLGKPRTNSD